MADHSKPFQPPDPELENKRTAEIRRLATAYKRCFQTPSGATVLADLRHRFGWTKWEAEDTEDADLIARRCAAKGPLFHIQRQLDLQFRQGKPVRPGKAEQSPSP